MMYIFGGHTCSHFSDAEEHNCQVIWKLCFHMKTLFHMKTVFPSVRNCKVFSRAAVTFYIPICNILSDPISLHACQHLMLSLIFILAVLIGIWWYFNVLLCFYFAFSQKLTRLIMYLCAYWPLEHPHQGKFLHVFCPFLYWIFKKLFQEDFMYLDIVHCLICGLIYSFPFHSWSFHPPNGSFTEQTFLFLTSVSCPFFLYGLCFWC